MSTNVSEGYRQELTAITSPKPQLTKASNPQFPSNSDRSPRTPQDAFSADLDAIAARLEAASNAKLIDTYSVLGNKRSMKNRLAGFRLKTKMLRAELERWDSWEKRVLRLLYGDGLDSNIGRLKRDVLWFVKELEYRQLPKVEGEGVPNQAGSQSSMGVPMLRGSVEGFWNMVI